MTKPRTKNPPAAGMHEEGFPVEAASGALPHSKGHLTELGFRV